MWFEVQPPVPVLAFLWRAEQRASPHPISVSGHSVDCLPSILSDEKPAVTWHLDLLHGSSTWQKAEVLLENIPSAALSSSQTMPGETSAACKVKNSQAVPQTQPEPGSWR